MLICLSRQSYPVLFRIVPANKMENLPLKQTLVQTQKNNSVRLGSLQQTKISLPMKPN